MNTPAPEGAGQPLKLVYVMSCGRSGSTLLDRLLGQVPGFFSGEVDHTAGGNPVHFKTGPMKIRPRG